MVDDGTVGRRGPCCPGNVPRISANGGLSVVSGFLQPGQPGMSWGWRLASWSLCQRGIAAQTGKSKSNNKTSCLFSCLCDPFLFISDRASVHLLVDCAPVSHRPSNPWPVQRLSVLSLGPRHGAQLHVLSTWARNWARLLSSPGVGSSHRHRVVRCDRAPAKQPRTHRTRCSPQDPHRGPRGASRPCRCRPPVPMPRAPDLSVSSRPRATIQRPP